MVSINGLEVAAAIANNLPEPEREKLLGAISKEDMVTAEQIIELMFVFENLAELEDRTVQFIICKLKPPTLLKALRGTTSAFREKFFSNMSTRQATELKEELANMPPVPKHQVEQSRQDILKLVKQLVKQGDIQLGSAEEFI